MAKKMLIVGGAGYVGGYMTDLFNSDIQYDVTVYDSLLYERQYLKDVKFIFGDIRDTEKLSKIINDYDVIVWLAALVGDGACAINKILTYQINYEPVKWLVDNYSKGMIVFMSTCSVYGINNNIVDEASVTNPISEYATTKLLAEQYIVAHAKEYLIFRLGTLYGIGDIYSRIRLDLVVNTLTLKATRGEPLTVFGGQQWRPILHVKDVSNAVQYCLKRDIRGLYVLSERNVEINSLAKEIQKIIPGTKVTYQDMKFEDLRDYKVNNEKINATGWKPFLTLDDGIKQLNQIFVEKRVTDTANPVFSNVNYLRSIDYGGNGKWKMM